MYFQGYGLLVYCK